MTVSSSFLCLLQICACFLSIKIKAAEIICEVASSLAIDSTLSSGWDCDNNGTPLSSACDWSGVTCNDSLIVSIMTSKVPVTGGTIPTSFGGISTLTSLNLNACSLVGSIPTEIGSLSSLKVLDLSENSITGPIPTELSSVFALIFFALDNNQISGTLSPDLGKLTNLISLTASFNKLSGTIPTEIGLLTNLRRLRFEANSITGRIPEELYLLTLLQADLILASNKLTGSISPSIGNLGLLRYLSLEQNQLTGPIPITIGSLVNLTYLLLNSNYLTSSIPSELHLITDLRYLNFSSNSITSTIPSELGLLVASLRTFIVLDNLLTGSIPPELFFLTKLQALQLGSNQISGSIPSVISTLNRFTSLQLSDNKFTGAYPTGLFSFAGIQSLSLGGNSLMSNNRIDEKFTRTLTFLSIAGSNFEGTIPTEIGTATRLKAFSASDNKLTGIIPTEISLLANLTSLRLDYNSLDGSIPEAIYTLNQLREVFLKANSLTGTLSESIGPLTNLEIFNVETNFLAGPIPSSLGLLSYLTYLDLNQNVFTGTFDSSICNVPLAQLILCDDCGDSASKSGCPFITYLPYCLVRKKYSKFKCLGSLRGELTEKPKLSLSVTAANTTSADIAITLLSTNNLEYSCSAFPSYNDVKIVSTLQVGGTTSTRVTTTDAALHVSNLVPVTSYDIYCFARSEHGVPMDLEDIRSTKVSFTTACCKNITFLSSPNEIRMNSNSDYFIYKLSSLPSDSVIITPVISVSGVSVKPASITFSRDSSSLQGSFLLMGSIVTEFSLDLAVSGPSAAEYFAVPYIVSFISSGLVIRLEPPNLRDVVFTDNGGGAYVTFDKSTDLGGGIDCSGLLQYPGIPFSSCSWVNTSSILLTFPPAVGGSAESPRFTLPIPGDELTLQGGLLKYCEAAICSDPAVEHTIQFRSPAHPVAPIINVILAPIFGSNEDIVADPSGTSGSGGRPYSMIEWTITSDGAYNISSIIKILESYDDVSFSFLEKPLIIPGGYIDPANYSLILTIRNFLGAYATKSYPFTISTSEVPPFVSILGPSVRSVGPSDLLLFQAYIDRQVSSALTYSWTVADESGFSLDVTSLSVDPRLLKFAVNGSLVPLNTYTAKITVSTLSGLNSSATAQVYYDPGSIVAVIAGGDERLVDVNHEFVIDASSSINKNPGVQLKFRWECMVLTIDNYGEDCSSLLVGLNADKKFALTFPPNFLQPNFAYQITCTCFAELRYGSKSIILQTTSGVPIVSLISLSSRANVKDIFTMQGIVQANYNVSSLWKVQSSVDKVDIESISLSPISNVFPLSDARPFFQFSLSIDTSKLVAGGTYIFTMSARSISSQNVSYASISLTMNIPPSQGYLEISPSSGEAFVTLFSIKSIGWLVESGGYPLQYELLYQVDESSLLSIVSRGFNGVASSTFPSTNAGGSIVWVISNVYDAFGASSSTESSVTVFPSKGTVDDVLQSFNSSLATASLSYNLDLTMQAVNNVAIFLKTDGTVNETTHDATIGRICRALSSTAQGQDQSSSNLANLITSLSLAYDPSKVLSERTLGTCLGLLSNLSSTIATDLPNTFNTDTAIKIADVISSLSRSSSSIGSVSRRLSDSSHSSSVGDVLGDVLSSLCAGVIAQQIGGQTVRLSSSAIDLSVTTQPSFSLGNLNLSSTKENGSFGSSFALPEDGLDACGVSSSGYSHLAIAHWYSSPYEDSSNLTSGLMRFTSFRSNYDIRNSAKSNSSFLLKVNFVLEQNFTRTYFRLNNATYNYTSVLTTLPGCTVRFVNSFIPCDCNLVSYTSIHATFSCNIQNNICGEHNVANYYLDADDSSTANPMDIREYGSLLTSASEVFINTFGNSKNPFAFESETTSTVVIACVIAWIGVLIFGLIYFRSWDVLDHKMMIYCPVDPSTIKKQPKSIVHLQELRKRLDNAFNTRALITEEEFDEDHYEYNKSCGGAALNKRVRNQLSIMVGGTIIPRFAQAIIRFHPFTWFFTDPSLEKTRVLRFMTLLKSILLIIFISTIFYSVYYPSDGRCSDLNNTSAEECYSKPSRVLSSLTECEWSESSGACSLRPPPRTASFIIAVSILTTIIFAPFDLLFFVVLNMICNRRPKLETIGLNSFYWLGGSDYSPPGFTDVNVSFAVSYVARSIRAFEMRLEDGSCTADEIRTMRFALPKLGLRLVGGNVKLSLISSLLYGSVSESVAARVKVSAENASTIIENLRRFNEDASKESYLVQQFVMEQFNPIFRITLRRQFCHYAHDLPRSIHPIIWAAAWVFIIAVDLFFIVWILLWGTSNNEITLVNWGANFGLSVFEEVFIISIIRIFILNIVFVEMMKPTLTIIYNMLLLKAPTHFGDEESSEEELTRTELDTQLLVYTSAARVVARHPEFAHLATAQIIGSIDDDDYVQSPGGISSVNEEEKVGESLEIVEPKMMKSDEEGSFVL